MGWFDDLSSRVQQEAGNAVKDIQTYIQNRAVDQVVKVAEEQKGNLTALQIAAGSYGGTVPQAAPVAAAAATANASQASQIAIAGMSLTTVALIAAGAYFLLGSKSKKRG